MVVKKDLTVGDVASRSGLAISTIHFYDEIGLITSWRNNANHRRYPRDVLRKLAVIKVAQRAGIPLKEVGEALSAIPNKGKVTVNDWRSLATSWKGDLNDRIDRLIRLRDTIGYCIGCGCLSVKDCKMMNSNDKLGLEGSGPRLLDPDD